MQLLLLNVKNQVISFDSTIQSQAIEYYVRDASPFTAFSFLATYSSEFKQEAVRKRGTTGSGGG